MYVCMYLESGMVTYAFNPSPWEAEAEEASLVYIAKSKPIRATKGDPVSENGWASTTDLLGTLADEEELKSNNPT